MRLCPHSIGDIIQSQDGADPNTLWPNTTWQALSDVFLYASGTNAAGDTGGSSTHSHTLGAGHAQIILKSDGKVHYREKRVTDWTSNYRVSASSASSAGGGQGWGACLAGSSDDATALPPYEVADFWKRTA